MKHTISVLVENKFGVLAHISSLFSARGFNINSLAVGETEDPTISRMTIVVTGDDRTLEQVDKQLNKLIDVIRVDDLTKKNFVDRELLLFKIEGDSSLKAVLGRLKAEILDENQGIMLVQFCGSKKETEELFNGLKGYEIKEMVRTGKIAIAKDKE
ncbi:MAG: acetolactate synthase small subunit [Candidatus Omnitrophica bacterium]|nr:acetolactate synthase small subunit [Candidatus Omnitrophota bacterium]